MAIQRINIDTRGKNILQLFFDNMEEIGAINKLTRDDGADTYDGPAGPVPIAWPKKGKYKNAWKYPITYQKYFVREVDSNFNDGVLSSVDFTVAVPSAITNLTDDVTVTGEILNINASNLSLLIVDPIVNPIANL